jgi:hypothetical protein
MEESASNSPNKSKPLDRLPGDGKGTSVDLESFGKLIEHASQKNDSDFGWIGFLVAGLVICAVSIAWQADLAKAFLVIGLPCFLLAIGFFSMKSFKRHALQTMRSKTPIKMKITSINKQRLWFNSVNDKSSYQIDLAPIDTNQDFKELKVDAADAQSALGWQGLFDGAKDGVVAQVFVDDKGTPVAVCFGEALAFRAGWWGDS